MESELYKRTGRTGRTGNWQELYAKFDRTIWTGNCKRYMFNWQNVKSTELKYMELYRTIWNWQNWNWQDGTAELATAGNGWQRSTTADICRYMQMQIDWQKMAKDVQNDRQMFRTMYVQMQ